MSFDSSTLYVAIMCHVEASTQLCGNQVDAIDDPDCIYDLCAVVIHIGGQPNRGHYVSIVRSHDHWLLFDDEIVDVCEMRCALIIG